MSSAPLDAALASLAPSYAVDRELGGGGMSRVFLARDVALGRRVVLKLLPPELTAGLSAERFRREIHVAAGLQHPHIVPLLAAGEADGILWYSMPFIEGDSLRARLQAGGALPVDEVVRLGREVASALAYAHRQGLIHRDIKPENVLLCDGHALVTDFGIAKAIATAAAGGDRPAGAPAGTMLTAVGTAIGTPAYMAPEQGVGDPSSDHRADLYSLGIMLYEMLAGGTPFGGRTTPHQYLTAHMVEAPAPLAGRRPDVPPALAALVDRLLAKAPDDRPASADDVVRDLDGALRTGAGPAVAPVSPVAGGAAPAAGRRRWVPLAAGAAAVLAVAVGIAVAGRPSAASRAAAAAAPAEAAADRVIVLPFANETGDPSLDPVGRMAADWLTRGLAETGLVKLMDAAASGGEAGAPGAAAAATASAAASPADRLAAARAAGAGTVVTGRYYKLGDSLYFELRMLDARSGEITGTLAPVSGPAASPTAALDRLNRGAMGALAARFNPALADFARQSARPPSYEAYQAYVAGQELVRRSDYRGALARFEEAVRLDTGWVTARFGVIEVLENTRQLARADTMVKQLEARAASLSPLERATLDEYATSVRGDIPGNLAAAFRMHALSPGGQFRATLATKLMNANRLPEALDTLDAANAEVGVFEKHAWVQTLRMRLLHHTGQHERALAEALALRKRFAGDVSLIGEYMTALAALGRVDELRALEPELRATPGMGSMRVLRRSIATEMQGHGHEEKARRLLEEVLAAYDSMPADSARMAPARFGKAATLSALGRHAEAYALVKDAARDTAIGTVLQVAPLAAWAGDRAVAMAADARLAAQETEYQKGAWHFQRARIAAALGDAPRAVDLLREALRQGLPVHLYWHSSAEIRRLKGNPAFEELIRPRR